MKIRELGLHNFRKFRQPVRLDGLVDGLNLVCEPNETGKSTVLEALRAVLFERHRSTNKHIQSFLPFGDQSAPSVKLAFELESGLWTVEKRFLQSPMVRLEGPSGQTFESDAAEEQLQALLGFTRAGNAGANDDTRGALGLLWVEQGIAFQIAPPGEGARRTIESVLASEVGAITGGRRLATVTASIEKALTKYVTPTGRPREQLTEAIAEQEQAEAEATAADEALRELEEAMDALDRQRQELTRIERDLADPELEETSKRLAVELEQARLLAANIRVAEGEWRQAVMTREQSDAQQALRVRKVEELAAAETTAADLSQALSAAQDILDAARSRQSEAAVRAGKARNESNEAEAAHTSAMAAVRDYEKGRALRAARVRLAQAEVIAAQIQALEQTIASNPMTEEAFAELETLEKALLAATATASVGAGNLEVQLEPAAKGKAILDGEMLSDGETRQLLGSTLLAVEGIGRFTFSAKSGAQADAARKKATADVEALLRRLGFKEGAICRKTHRDRQSHVSDLKAATRRLADLCVADDELGIDGGLPALRTALAEQAPVGGPDQDINALGRIEREAQRANSEARAALSAEEAAQIAAIHTLGADETALAKAQMRHLSAVSLASKLTTELTEERDELPDVDLEARVSGARRLEEQRGAALAQINETGVDLDPVQIQKRIDAANRRRRSLEEDRVKALETIARLTETVHVRGVEGPSTRLDGAREALAAAVARTERLRDEAAALMLLKRTLVAASLEASIRYLAPVTSRAEPYVRRLLPGASLTFGEDMSPSVLERSGRSEPADQLSMGTQEQLAVLTRIAFADLLVEKGKPASLVLDDALVFSDDVRFDTMLEILTEVSRRMQVIILTCRASLFRSLDANKVRMSRVGD